LSTAFLSTILFFFNATATTHIYTLSLHDALPIFPNLLINGSDGIAVGMATKIPPHNLTEIVDATLALLKDPEMSVEDLTKIVTGDRKSTRLNSSHSQISYAVFCLKKKKKQKKITR